MGLDSVGHDRHPEAAARHTPGFVPTPEAVEHLVPVSGRDPGPLIGDDHHPPGETGRDGRTRRRELDRVVEHVDQRPFEAARIAGKLPGLTLDNDPSLAGAAAHPPYGEVEH